MQVDPNQRLGAFAKQHPDSARRLKAWRKALIGATPANFAELRQVFNSVDVVGDYFVFNVGGNNYRIVCYINFEEGRCYIRHVLTHAEYDRGKWKR